MSRRALLGVIMTCSFAAAPAFADDEPWVVRSTRGLVASDNPEASRIGADILAAGGNAFDAAVATSFALTVARPESTGLGGGGFMLAYLAYANELIALDFRETAPAGATVDYYARLRGEKPDWPSPSLYGGGAVGVPGQLAGLVEINRRFGTRALGDLIRPAAALAQVGFAADAHYRASAAEVLEQFKKHPTFKYYFARLYEDLLFEGKLPPVGTRIRRPQLARGFQLLIEHGPSAFYEGPIAEAIIAAVAKTRGVMTPADLRGYELRERTPLRGRFGRFELVCMPPPSSGGVCLLEILNLLDCQAEAHGGVANLQKAGVYEPLLVRAFQHAFADRARWLGDADGVSIPLDRLTSRTYACELLQNERNDPANFGSIPPDDRGTSHFCVVDAAGNVVAMTETVNSEFGSFVVAEPFGIILNNEMDDFTTTPGEPNLYGLVQGSRNLVAPGRRPLSSMSPTIVLEDGRPVFAVGGAGGPRIITAVAQVLLNALAFDRPLAEAVAHPRLHQQWQPAEVFFDTDLSAETAERSNLPEIAERLKAAGYSISDKRRTAAVQAIQRQPDGAWIGVSDPRKGGRPAAP